MIQILGYTYNNIFYEYIEYVNKEDFISFRKEFIDKKSKEYNCDETDIFLIIKTNSNED